MKKIILHLLVLLAAGATQAVRAEEVPLDTTKVVDIEEVVVIATPKENSRLRQQALSATSLSQADMRGNAVRSVKSLSALVPNLFIPDYGSKLTTSVYVRGIGSRINTPAVGLYVDNIPFIDKSAFDFNYSDIERIDVMRGPQGTLYGRNTMGGLIRVFTKSPFTYQGTDLTLGAATYHHYKASVSHYHRISPRFAFSANFFYEHKGGFFENSYLNERADRGDEFGGRFRAIWLPRENLKLDFTLNYEYTDQGGYPYEYTGVTEGEEDRADYIGRIAYNHRSGYRRNLLNGGLNLEHQADQFILSSVTGFQYLDDRMDLDQDFTERDIYTMRQKQHSRTVSEELVLKSKPGRRWQWTTGAAAFYQWLDTDAPVTFREDGVRTMIEDHINAGLSQLPAGAPTLAAQITTRPLPVPGRFKTPVLNGAIYHQSTFHDVLAEGLSFTLGLRLDYEKLRLDYRSSCDMDFNFSVSAPFLPMEIIRELNARTAFVGKEFHDYLQLLPKFSVQYAWNSQNNVYATVSKGYRSGGYNIQMFSDLIQGSLQSAMMNAIRQDEVLGNFAGMMPDFPAPDVNVREATLYRPEYSWNYEAGTHLTLFDAHLQADLAAFYMDTHDQQISRFAASGLGRVTVNAGRSRSLGAEAALRARLTDALSLSGSYGYTLATFTDYVVSDEVNYNGKHVPFVPKHTFNVGGQYIFTMKRGRWLDHITLDAHYKAAGRIYWTEANDASQPLYGTLNGRLSFHKGNGQIALWADNALNKRYQAFWFETMGRGFAQMGRPVQVGIDLRCRF